ncbi:hypothetical protein ACEPAH_2729 [Sanghuangporus vaninii]
MHLSLSFVLSGIAISSAFASLLSRQDEPGTACVSTCIANADLDGCSATDNVCLCKSQAFIDSIETCFDRECEAQDLENARVFVEATCEAVGVTIPAPAA